MTANSIVGVAHERQQYDSCNSSLLVGMALSKPPKSYGLRFVYAYQLINGYVWQAVTHISGRG